MENIRNLFAHSFGNGKCDVENMRTNKNKLKKGMSLDESLLGKRSQLQLQESLDVMSFETKMPSSRVRSVSECSTSSIDETSLTAHAQSSQVAGNKMESEAYFWIISSPPPQ